MTSFIKDGLNNLTGGTNIFKNVLTNLNEVETNLFGDNKYDYVANIKTPNELKMGESGNKIAQNISGLISYVQLLVSGNSNASKNNSQPLGNKYFLKVGGNCIDKDSNKEVERSIYINNIPDGSIPFISQAMGVNFTSLKGLVPGAIGSINNIKPAQILQSFSLGDMPTCQAIELETINSQNTKSKSTAYLTTVDIENMSPCWFPNKINPITNNQCRETFSNLKNAYNIYDENYNNLYLTISSIFLLYLIIKLANNRLK
jgi:hypothetical protein